MYGNDLVEWIDPAGEPGFYHADGLGSVRALSDLAGRRTDAYNYDVFGALRSHAGGAGQPYGFTGEQADDELGLIYLRTRYYDPQVGRFLTKDQFEGFRDGTQGRNRYIYVENNPAGRIDPAGLTWQIFGGIEGGFMLGPIKIGGSGELVHHYAWRTRDEARAALFFYIESFNNRRRRHSALGYLSPDDYEQLYRSANCA